MPEKTSNLIHTQAADYSYVVDLTTSPRNLVDDRWVALPSFGKKFAGELQKQK